MTKYAFAKKNRLQKSKEFRLLSQKGNKIKGKYFIVLFKLNKNLPEAKLGITVSKKCSKKAVLRNRIKRIVRESFRFNKHQLNGYEIVVIGRRYAVLHDNSASFNELDKMWQKLANFCKSV